jgi:Protein of unknown function (DUF3185)
MPATRLVGLILIAGALVTLGIAYQQSGSFGDQTKHLFTGNYRDNTTWLVVGGALAGVLGLVSLLAPGRGGGR